MIDTYTDRYTLPSGEVIDVYSQTPYNIVETAILPVMQFIGLMDTSTQNEENRYFLDMIDLLKILLERADKEIWDRFREIEAKIGTARALYATKDPDYMPGGFGRFVDAEVELPENRQEAKND